MEYEGHTSTSYVFPLSVHDANAIIPFLSAGFAATTAKPAQDEFLRLANELRKASGQSINKYSPAALSEISGVAGLLHASTNWKNAIYFNLKLEVL